MCRRRTHIYDCGHQSHSLKPCPYKHLQPQCLNSHLVFEDGICGACEARAKVLEAEEERLARENALRRRSIGERLGDAFWEAEKIVEGFVWRGSWAGGLSEVVEKEGVEERDWDLDDEKENDRKGMQEKVTVKEKEDVKEGIEEPVSMMKEEKATPRKG